MNDEAHLTPVCVGERLDGPALNSARCPADRLGRLVLLAVLGSRREDRAVAGVRSQDGSEGGRADGDRDGR
jgi:hypothetical protein